MDETVVLEAKDLHKAFYHPTQVTLLRGICLKVRRGEAVAIRGRSGEGKSTLLQVFGNA